MKYKGYTLANAKCELRDLCFSSVIVWRLKTRDVCSTARYRTGWTCAWLLQIAKRDNKHSRHVLYVALPHMWNTHKVLSQNIGLISTFWKCDIARDNATVLFLMADLAENTNHITIFAPSSCHYVRQKDWYSAAQVLRYSFARVIQILTAEIHFITSVNLSFLTLIPLTWRIGWAHNNARK